MANITAPIKSHFVFSVLKYLSATKYKTVQLNTSKEFGWYKSFSLRRAENNTHVEPKIKANRFPFNSSIAFQTIYMVNAPYAAGKNLIQNIELPSS